MRKKFCRFCPAGHAEGVGMWGTAPTHVVVWIRGIVTKSCLGPLPRTHAAFVCTEHVTFLSPDVTVRIEAAE